MIGQAMFYLILFVYGHNPAIIPRAYPTKADCVAAGKYAFHDIKSRSDYATVLFVCVPYGEAKDIEGLK